MALLLHSRAGFDFLFVHGQEMLGLRSQSGRPVPETALFIKNDLNAESAGRSHSEQVIKSWWYDTVSLSTRPLHAAYMRVMQTALRVLRTWYNS